MNRRRLTQALVLTAIMLLPLMAWGADCAEASGSDTGRFKALVEQHGVIVAVIASFGFGFLASLTPCVYPMVPITVSIFGATEAKSRLRGAALSLAFVLGIATLFTTMGVVSALSGKLMGSALSNTYVVIALAVLFTALAASMFGAFEIALPSSLTNKLSTVGGVGFKGAFVMGLVMGLIAAPCTGPFITGMVVYIAETKSVALGSASFFSFSLGLGVLFFIAGSFAVALPKGGAWMMGIKWVSGVGLAYMAFVYLRDKFEPIRKLVDHPSYGFGALAGGILLAGLVLGTVHIIAERRKSPIAHLSKKMKLLSIAPAVVGAAMTFTWIGLNHSVDPNAPQINWLSNEKEAKAKAASEGKPMLIDFGAEWCTACKEMEHKTFPDPSVRTAAQRFVTVRADMTDDENEETKRLTEKYNIKGLPTIVMFDKDGKEVIRFNEEVHPDKLYAAMQCASAGSPNAGAVGMK